MSVSVTNIFRALSHDATVIRGRVPAPNLASSTFRAPHHKRHRWRYTGHLLAERSSVAVFWS